MGFECLVFHLIGFITAVMGIREHIRRNSHAGLAGTAYLRIIDTDIIPRYETSSYYTSLYLVMKPRHFRPRFGPRNPYIAIIIL